MLSRYGDFLCDTCRRVISYDEYLKGSCKFCQDLRDRYVDKMFKEEQESRALFSGFILECYNCIPPEYRFCISKEEVKELKK